MADMPLRTRFKRSLLNFVVKTIQLLPPDKVLRFLFRLDRWLYFFQGKMASVYGKGVHTKHRHIRYHDFFISRISPGERVLDVGSNNGAVSYDVAEKAGAYVVGIEIEPANIELARKLHPHPRIEYRLGDVLTDLSEEPFDVVILSNILEHLPERPALLRKIQQLTKPSRILIRVPLFERDWRVPLKKELGVEWRLDPTHEIEYTLEEFAEEMEAAGLKITHQEVRWGEIWVETKPTDKQVKQQTD